MLTRNRRESRKEVVDGVPCLEIIKKGLHRHAGTGKHRSAAHDLRRAADDRLIHEDKANAKGARNQGKNTWRGSAAASQPKKQAQGS